MSHPYVQAALARDRQNMLLAERNKMDQIAEAIRKIQKHAGDLARA